MQDSFASMLSNRKHLFFLIIASTILLYFVFSPTLNMLFYGGDDFRYAFGGPSKSCATDDGFYFAKTVGRPIQAYMDCFSYKFFYNLERMRLLRIIAVGLMGGGMGLLAYWLLSVGFSSLLAIFAAGSLLMVSRLYGDAVLTGATSLVSPILLVVLAYLCINKADSVAIQSRKVLWYFLAASFIFCALLTYPAMTFFFGTLVLIKLLFSNLDNWRKTRLDTLKDVLFFSFIGILYFIYAYLNMRYNAQAPIPDAYRLDHPNLNPIEIFKRAIPLANVYNGAWAIFPLTDMVKQGRLFLILLSGGVFIGTYQFTQSPFYIQNKKRAVTYLLQSIIAVIILLVFCSTFFLIMPSRDSDGSRLLFATMVSFLPLLFWSLYYWSSLFSRTSKLKFFTLLMGIFFLIEAYQANLFMMMDAFNSTQRIYEMKTTIANYLAQGNTLQRVHFVVPEAEFPYDKFFLVNAALTQLKAHGSYQLVWCSLPRGVPGAEKDHQKEALNCIQTLPENGIAITFTHPGDSAVQTAGSLLIEGQTQLLHLNDWIAKS